MKKTAIHKFLKRAFLGISLLLIAAVCTAYYLYNRLEAFGNRINITDEPVLLNIEKGASVSEVVRLLYEKKVTGSEARALLYYRVFFRNQTLKAGFYRLPEASSLHDVLDMIIKGDIATEKLTIIEGSTIWEINEVISGSKITGRDDFFMLCYNKEFLAELKIPFGIIEGFIYPDTYVFPLGIPVKDAVRIMVARSFDIYEKISETATNPMDIGEAMILASLIEKESPSKEEGPVIASVYLNRLDINMLLQCDPTVIYALKRNRLYDGRLLKKDLSFDDPYNTYLYKGLPPSPIASPGYYSIFSAMNPARTDYLYFVAKDDSSHVFAETYREHQRNIIKVRKNKK